MKYALIALAAALVLGGAWYVSQMNTTTVQNERMPGQSGNEEGTERESGDAPQGASIGEENLVEFQCDDSKKITAVFTRDIVGLTLSDGRQMELRQDAAGSGVKYISVGGAIEFRGKGEGGMLIEGGRTTYANCVAAI